MIISSWNVNSVRARINNIKEYLKKSSPDIVMMQEIKTEEKNYPFDEFKSLKYESYVFGQKSYNGVAFISKNKLNNIKQNINKSILSLLILIMFGCRGEVVPTDNDLSSYGWVMYESGDYVGALDWFITAIKEDSSHSDAYNGDSIFKNAL